MHPGASHEGRREAGIGQRRGCHDRINVPRGAPSPYGGRIFLRKTLLHPCAVALRLLHLTLLRPISDKLLVQLANPNAAVKWLSKTCRTAALCSNVSRLASHRSTAAP